MNISALHKVDEERLGKKKEVEYLYFDADKGKPYGTKSEKTSALQIERQMSLFNEIKISGKCLIK